MIKREVKLRSEIGLHARPSAQISRVAKTFDASTKITITNPLSGSSADARSLLSLLCLAVDGHQTVILSVEGKDEERAFLEIADVIENYSVD
jgi:phosphotransferase system HPr (HPr) family protein